jgi:hypothetical protein
MLGHAEEWFYRRLAGIDFDLNRAENRRIWIHPQTVAGLQFVSASYRSVLGQGSSTWRRQANALRLDVRIPTGTFATIEFPSEFTHSLTESGHALQGDEEVLSVNDGEGRVTIVVASGTYHFVAQRGATHGKD